MWHRYNAGVSEFKFNHWNMPGQRIQQETVIMTNIFNDILNDMPSTKALHIYRSMLEVRDKFDAPATVTEQWLAVDRMIEAFALAIQACPDIRNAPDPFKEWRKAIFCVDPKREF